MSENHAYFHISSSSPLTHQSGWTRVTTKFQSLFQVEVHVSTLTFYHFVTVPGNFLRVWLLVHTRREILWQTLTVGKNVVWPYHRRHLDFTEWTFTCLSLPFTAVSMFTRLPSQRRWLPSDSGKDEQAWCVSVIKAPGQQTWWDTSFHVKFFCDLGPSLTITLTQILHVTMSDVSMVCVCGCVSVRAVGPLTGMEAACWTNSLTNVSTFPPSPCLTSLSPHPSAKLTSTDRAERGGLEEKRERQEKMGRGARWQAADPFALPSDSVYLHFTPWGFVSEDSAMMNRPVSANLAEPN